MKQAFQEWFKDIIKRSGKYRFTKNDLIDGKELPLTVQFLRPEDCIQKQDVDLSDYEKKFLDRKTSTSGTTGKPLIFYQSIFSLQKEQAYIDWLWELAGYNSTKRVVVMRGIKGIKHTSSFSNRLLIDSLNWSEEGIKKKYNEFLDFQPDFIDCYPSLLERFLKKCDSLGLNAFPKVKGVLAGSEACLPHQEEMFKIILGAETISWYGQSEQVALGLKVSNEEFHFLPQYSELAFLKNNGMLEIVGKSKISSFFSEFYYRTGDFCEDVKIGYNEKLNTPVYIIKGLVGRNPETIILKNKDEIPLNHIIFGLHSELWHTVDRYCFVQAEPGTLKFFYSINNLEKNFDINELLTEIKSRIPSEVLLEPIFLQELSLVNNPKWRYYFKSENDLNKILYPDVKENE